MTTIITIGNLTKDAEVKTTRDGRRYVLLQVAENIRKRDDKGEYIKDANGHFQNEKSFYWSVFVNDGNNALTVSELKAGKAIKVVGRAKINIEKDADGYDKYVVDRIVAKYIDIDPFKQLADTDNMASDEDLNDEPVEIART